MTDGIKVSVATAFLPADSSISRPRFTHAYRITYVTVPNILMSHLVLRAHPQFSMGCGISSRAAEFGRGCGISIDI